MLPFDPVTEQWFHQRFDGATDVQLRAWPVIAAGRHVLVTAPTGTGKTLAAFLGALDALLSGRWEAGRLRVLYVSPLKALNNDVQRNLLGPLGELSTAFAAAGREAIDVRVMVRSGDTPEDERRRLRKHPPEILITTPESLNILLTQKQSASLFGGLRAVIIDEVHAIAGSKRGTSLFLALERLVEYAGEFQRVGLSATVNPPGLIAQVVGGFISPGTPRPVELIASPHTKRYDVRVVVPEVQVRAETGKTFWESLARELTGRTRERASTLIFANSRRACERLARLMNEVEDGESPVAYPHHGSLSKDLRRDVEVGLKGGDLRAVVATNSLELGIDIGDLDEVVLAETPRSAASAIQKVGRAGHRIDEVSRARLYPSHGLDFVEAAVMLRCIQEQLVEPVTVPEGPFDVLAQSLLAEWSSSPSSADHAFDLVRRSWPYRHLSREAFDVVVDMLAGRYANTRIPELKPRIEATPLGQWQSKASVPFLLYSSGGTIPDRGYFTMRDRRTGAALGELDEEFVWERNLGDRFALGAQVWRIAQMDDQAVHVEPVESPPHIIPFWKAESQDRSWFLAEKVALFLEESDRVLAGGGDPAVLAPGFEPAAAEALLKALTDQRDALGCLPHRWRLVVERVETPREGAMETDQYILHTLWGARSNRPWAFALAQAWEDRFGYALETYAGDDQIILLVPPETDLGELLGFVTPENLEGLLRRRLETTGYFGARFREGAGRALLLPKPGFDRRTPLWQTRLRSKRLFEAVSNLSDFPVLLEAWRECLRDEFELEELKARLDERETGRIETVYRTTSHPSPFTEGLLWRQVNEHMYAGDEPPARSRTVDQPLWDQLSERPLLSREAVADWESRWGRTAPGYAPETPADLADFVEVRVALFPAEWEALLDACVRESGLPRPHWEAFPLVNDGRVGIPSLSEAWEDLFPLLERWLEGRGPIDLVRGAAFWRIEEKALERWAKERTEAGVLVFGRLTEDAGGDQFCLARAWEQLVRRARLVRRTTAPTRSASALPLYLARRQGLVRPEAAPELEGVVGRLLGYPAAADLWEGALLPSRVSPYRPADFDALFSEGGLRWFGVGMERVVLGFPEDREVFLPPRDESAEAQAAELLPTGVELTLSDLAQGRSIASLTTALWELAWKGAVSPSSFAPLRQGLLSGFAYDAKTDIRTPRSGFQRWSKATTVAWRRWDRSPVPQSKLELTEDAKRRARLVLDRYGIVFRTLLAHEGPAFQWRELFPALRLMELSGEIIGGMFWTDVPGLQFATPAALRELEAGGDEDRLWVQHAQDPSSLCGLGLDAVPNLPRRTTGTWLVWRGEHLVLTVTSSGKRLDFAEDPTEEVLGWMTRRLSGVLTAQKTNWTIETIGDQPAGDHSTVPLLRVCGFQVHGDKLILWKQ